MNRNIVMPLVLGAIMGVAIAYIAIFSATNPPEEPIKKVTIKREIIVEEQEIPFEPGRMLPRNIFPTDAEAKKNITRQLEKQEAIERTIAEKTQIAAEVRNNVEASIDHQPAFTSIQPVAGGHPVAGQLNAAGSSASSSSTSNLPAAQGVDMNLQKIRIQKFKMGEYRIHH